MPDSKCECTHSLVSAPPRMAHGTALLLNNEISSVVTAMKNNSKWALVPNRYGQRVHRI